VKNQRGIKKGDTRGDGVQTKRGNCVKSAIRQEQEWSLCRQRRQTLGLTVVKAKDIQKVWKAGTVFTTSDLYISIINNCKAFIRVAKCSVTYFDMRLPVVLFCYNIVILSVEKHNKYW